MLFENSHNWDIATQLNGVELSNREKKGLVLRSALKRYKEGLICMRKVSYVCLVQRPKKTEMISSNCSCYKQ